MVQQGPARKGDRGQPRSSRVTAVPLPRSNRRRAARLTAADGWSSLPTHEYRAHLRGGWNVCAGSDARGNLCYQVPPAVVCEGGTHRRGHSDAIRAWLDRFSPDSRYASIATRALSPADPTSSTAGNPMPGSKTSGRRGISFEYLILAGTLTGANSARKTVEARVGIEPTYKGFADHAGEVVLIETG